MDNQIKKPLLDLATSIEQALAKLYAFEPIAAVNAHILGREELILYLGDGAKENENYFAHGALWVVRDEIREDNKGKSSPSMFLGIHFSDTIFLNLCEQNPIAKLSHVNLNSFWTVIEEVSHFHLFLNRMTANRPIGRLELECQAEIDKIILAACVLKEQVNQNHLPVLKNALFNKTEIYHSDDELYYKASQVAYEFMTYLERIIDEHGLNSECLMDYLRTFYYAPFSDKMSFGLRAAS